MHYTATNKQKAQGSLILQDLLIKTKEDLKKHRHKSRNKKLPVIASQNVFMVQLIKQQSDANKDIVNRSGGLVTQHSKSARFLVKEDKKSELQTSTQMIPRPMKINSFRESVKKIKLSSLISSPTAQDKKKELEMVRFQQRSRQKYVEEIRQAQLERDNRSFQTKNQTGSVRLSPKVQKKKHLSPIHKNEMKSMKIIEVASPSPKQFGHTHRVSLRKIIKSTGINIFNHKSSVIKQHLKTGFPERKIQVETLSYPRQNQDYNFQGRKDMRQKMPFTKKLESSLIITEEHPLASKRKKKVPEEILEPWNSYYPNEAEQPYNFQQ